MLKFKEIAQNAQNLQDKFDETNDERQKVEKLESQIKKYEIKLQSMFDLSSQIKQTNEINSKYLIQILKLEEVFKIL
jgi:hypothetical protein